jgi:hypothetical protein
MTYNLKLSEYYIGVIITPFISNYNLFYIFRYLVFYMHIYTRHRKTNCNVETEGVRTYSLHPKLLVFLVFFNS